MLSHFIAMAYVDIADSGKNTVGGGVELAFGGVSPGMNPLSLYFSGMKGGGEVEQDRVIR